MKCSIINVARFLSVMLCFALLFCSCKETKVVQKESEYGYSSVGLPQELKGIWISFYDLDFADYTEDGFIKSFDNMMNTVKNTGFNAVFVHVRSHADAYYKSDIFPWSKYITGTQGVSPDFDPLEIMCKLAHNRNLQLHAWINPFRVSTNQDTEELSDDNFAKICLLDDDKANDNYVKKTAGGIYYNPSSEYVRNMVISGVKEIVENYSVDGVHMDDYFYPSTEKSLDLAEYTAYCKTTADALSLEDFRRACMNDMVKKIYKTVKEHNAKTVFGISPQANMYNNLNMQYADVPHWCKNVGFVDYIMPQVYFGFLFDEDNGHSQSMRFDECVDYWCGLEYSNEVRLCFGLGLYRSGEKVSARSVAAQSEWIDNDDVIKRQIEYIRKKSGYGGFNVFAYSSMSQNNTAKKETANIMKLLKK